MPATAPAYAACQFGLYGASQKSRRHLARLQVCYTSASAESVPDCSRRRQESEPDQGEPKMSTIVVQAFITLDGVVQSGGGPDDDREGGFEHGGWMMDYDEQMDKLDEGGKIVAEWESRTEALLLGRKTYEIWAGAWGVWDENADGRLGELTRRYNRV